jgi:hypothetical protein
MRTYRLIPVLAVALLAACSSSRTDAAVPQEDEEISAPAAQMSAESPSSASRPQGRENDPRLQPRPFHITTTDTRALAEVMARFGIPLESMKPIGANTYEIELTREQARELRRDERFERMRPAPPQRAGRGPEDRAPRAPRDHGAPRGPGRP